MADNIYEEVEADALKDELSRVPLFDKPQTVMADLPIRDYQRSPYESVATIAKRNEVFLAAGISHDCLTCHHMRQQSESYRNVERDCMVVQSVVHCDAKVCIQEFKAPTFYNLCTEVMLPQDTFINAGNALNEFGKAVTAFSEIAGAGLLAHEPDLFDQPASDDELDRLDELLDDRPHNDAYGTW